MKAKHVALGIGGAIGAAVAWKLLTRPSSVDWHDFSDKIPHAEHSDFVEIDGATVHFQEFGQRSGKTLVLLHGYTSSVYIWKTVAPMLADEGFHVIAVDLVGFGYSDKPAWFDYTINSQARMVSRLMDRLGIGRATIVGSSYGGAVALTIALDYPERVERLVLAGSVINDEPKNHPLMKLARVSGVGEVMTPFVIDSKAMWKFRMTGSIAPPNHHLITEERVEAVRRPLYAKDGHNSVLQTSRHWHAERIEQDLGLVNQPTLIIWGENDNVIPVHNGVKLYESILHSRFVVLKDCGHTPMEEKSDLFTSLVTEFCNDPKGRVTAGEGMKLEGA